MTSRKQRSALRQRIGLRDADGGFGGLQVGVVGEAVLDERGSGAASEAAPTSGRARRSARTTDLARQIACTAGGSGCLKSGPTAQAVSANGNMQEATKLVARRPAEAAALRRHTEFATQLAQHEIER